MKPSTCFLQMQMLVCSICFAGSPIFAGNGPVAWAAPAQAPVLHAAMDEKAYANALADAQSRLKPGDVLADAPWTGAGIAAVESGSQAQSAGIHAGDVLVASDGQPVVDDDDWIRHRAAGDSVATVWSPVQGKRDLTLAPGLIGVNLKPYFHPEILYLRELAGGAHPDAVLFAAALRAVDSPGFARVAVNRLKKAGSDSPFIYLIDAIAAESEGQFEDAIASGMWAMQAGSADQRRALAPVMRSAALASFNLDLAAKLEKDFPDIKAADQKDEDTGKDYTVSLEKTVERCHAIQWKGPDRCGDAMDLAKPSDETARMSNAGKAGAGGKQAAESIRQSQRAPFNAPDDQYNLYVLGPVGADVRFTAHCRFSANKKMPENDTEQVVKFGVSFKGRQLMPIALSLSPDGTVDIEGTSLPPFSYRLANLIEPGKLFDVSLIIIGNRCEIYIAGVRAFYGPILEDEKSRKLCLVFQAVGVKGQLNRVKWETASP